MDMVLIVVTALSLAIAVAMGVVVMKMLREDRRRSDARVAALMEMAGGDQSSDGVGRGDGLRADVLRTDVLRAHVPRADVGRADVPGADVLRAEVPQADVLAADVLRADVARARQHGARPHVSAKVSHPSTVVADLFAVPQHSSPWASRFAVAAALALCVGGAGYLWLRPGTPIDPAVPNAATPAAIATAGAPLELLSLKHTQRQNTITVSGLVQNPASGAKATRVFATAFAFGPDGAFLASGRAPLDFTMLAPGDESPFVVTVPVTTRVARYRIGFRTEDGAVIAHVDRRQAEAVAMK